MSSKILDDMCDVIREARRLYFSKNLILLANNSSH